VPTINLPDDELAAVTAAIRRAIEDDRYPHAPRLDPLRAALARLERGVQANPRNVTTSGRFREGPGASQSRQAGAATLQCGLGESSSDAILPAGEGDDQTKRTKMKR
jgi:hypothetical protein